MGHSFKTQPESVFQIKEINFMITYHYGMTQKEIQNEKSMLEAKINLN